MVWCASLLESQSITSDDCWIFVAPPVFINGLIFLDIVSYIYMYHKPYGSVQFTFLIWGSNGIHAEYLTPAGNRNIPGSWWDLCMKLSSLVYFFGGAIL